MKIFMILLLLVFTACGEVENKKEVQPSTLKVALAYKPRSFDPHKHTDSATLAVTKQIYNNLFSLGEKGEAIPELVESYEIKDDSSIILKLKRGVFLYCTQNLRQLRWRV